MSTSWDCSTSTVASLVDSASPVSMAFSDVASFSWAASFERGSLAAVAARGDGLIDHFGRCGCGICRRRGTLPNRPSKKPPCCVGVAAVGVGVAVLAGGVDLPGEVALEVVAGVRPGPLEDTNDRIGVLIGVVDDPQAWCPSAAAASVSGAGKAHRDPYRRQGRDDLPSEIALHITLLISRRVRPDAGRTVSAIGRHRGLSGSASSHRRTTGSLAVVPGGAPPAPAPVPGGAVPFSGGWVSGGRKGCVGSGGSDADGGNGGSVSGTTTIGTV